MSTYETYDQTSASYDKTRIPVGVEILVGCFAQSRKRLDEMVVLDAGCGTGSYSQELLRFVGRIHAVDISEGMLAVAGAKLAAAHEAGRVEFLKVGLEAVPFGPESFDGIMVNQVLHHLDAPAAGGFPRQEEALRRLSRLLRPGGVLVINTCSQEQIFKGYWNTALVPEATARMADRYMSIDEVERVMRSADLTCRGRFVPFASANKSYLDGRGPLRKDWRDGDSLWALTTEAELERALQRVRDLDESGELDAFVARHDAERRNVGQFTFLYATR